MARKRGLKAWVQNRIGQTLDNADGRIDDIGDLLAELLQEVLDGVDVELTIKGKPTMFGIRLLPKGEDREETP